MKFRKEIQKNRKIYDDEIEKYMISNSIELEGIRMIIRNFIRKDEKKNV